jgi:hypothetical protein
VESSKWFARHAAAGPGWAALCAALFLNAPVLLVKDLPQTAANKDIYMAQGEVRAMEWLKGQPDGLVLSAYGSGNRLPMLSGKTVFIGHWFMTADMNRKNRLVAMVFSDQVPLDAKNDLLRSTGARYIYAGSAEAALGSLDAGLPVRRIYDQDGVVIYEVGHGA